MNERLSIQDLVGAKIAGGMMVDGGAHLNLTLASGRTIYVAVMSDPEGNGPGSLHLYAPPLLLAKQQSSELVGIIGGR